MLRTALEFIKKELDAYMADRENDIANYSPGSIVDLKSIVSVTGNVEFDNNKHIMMMLAGIEEERRVGKHPYIVPADNNRFARLNPPVELDLFVLFIAYNSDYPTALRDVSDVVAFFQANNVFDEQRYPGLNAGVMDPANKPWQLIDRLTFRLLNFSFELQNNLWGMLGGKYLPSVIYKMNMLTVFDTKSKDTVAAITNINFPE
jgi:hypothetical protein